MNIGGVDQVLSEGFSKELVRQMRLIRINHGGGDIAQLSPEEINEIGQVVKSASKRIRKLHLGRSKGAAWCRAETKSLFRSRDFLTAAALIQSVKREQILGLEEARHLAEQARDLSIDESVQFELVPKASGGERTIVKHGPIKSIRNRALALLVEAVSGPYEFEFCQFGRGGVHAAVERIGEGLVQGYRFWITCDLTKAYPSVKLNHVKDIVPIHGELLKRVCFPPYLHSSATNKDGGRPGLAEGASHSSKILSAFTDGPLRQIGGDRKVLCYADNIAIGARTIGDAKCAFKTLKNAMSVFMAGPIHLHAVTLCDGYQHSGHWQKGEFLMRRGVDFCQYRASLDWQATEVRYRPNTLAFCRAKHRAFELLEGIYSPEIIRIELDGYLEMWARSFTLWQRTELSTECLKQTRDRWLYEYLNGKLIDAA
tara:strand:- start:1212 stop:2492 length:1281 start_codon:yes stop_codon:yes gene_type:complete